MKQALIETGRQIMEKHLTWGTAGNLSARKEDLVYITASGTVLGDMKEEDIIVCDLQGNIIEGSKKPSKETQMHLEVYRKRPDIQAVIHTSPFYGTLCASSNIEIKHNLFIESMYYDQKIVSIPYYHAGSKELAEAVSGACRKSNVILMENHGLLVYDTNLKESLFALEITENVCKMNALAQAGKFTLREVDPEVNKEFLNGGYYKKRTTEFED